MSVSVELWQQCVELCAMNCLPSNSTPGSVRCRSKPLATNCAYAPNRFVLDWVNEKYLSRLFELLLNGTSKWHGPCAFLINRQQTQFGAAGGCGAVPNR